MNEDPKETDKFDATANGGINPKVKYKGNSFLMTIFEIHLRDIT